MTRKMIPCTLITCLISLNVLQPVHAENQSSTTKINYTVDEHYEWQIPKSVDLNENQAMKVQASNIIIGSKSALNIRVTSKNGFHLKDEQNKYNDVPYVLKNQNNSVFQNNSIVLSSPANTDSVQVMLQVGITDKNNIHASKYSDLLTFNAQVENREAN